MRTRLPLFLLVTAVPLMPAFSQEAARVPLNKCDLPPPLVCPPPPPSKPKPPVAEFDQYIAGLDATIQTNEEVTQRLQSGYVVNSYATPAGTAALANYTKQLRDYRQMLVNYRQQVDSATPK